jgi:NAD+ diphosphatase
MDTAYFDTQGIQESAGAVPLGAAPLERDIEHRGDQDLFDRIWRDPQTRVLVMNDGKALLTPASTHSERTARALSLRRVDEVTSALTRVYLGRARSGGLLPSGAPVVLEIVTDAAAAQLDPDREHWSSLRDCAALLGEDHVAVFTEAVAIANWHRRAQYCPSCGMPTVVEQGGWVRRCMTEDALHFPRLDPAVIVVITDEDDRLLLGHNTAWPDRRFSLLAGFVEPGETFEAAAVREVGEESGISITTPRYITSQPWPFPASVMIAMSARVEGGSDPDAFVADGVEIASLRWFTRDDLREAMGSKITLPGVESIARRLIDDWLENPAAGERSR